LNLGSKQLYSQPPTVNVKLKVVKAKTFVLWKYISTIHTVH